MKAFSLIALFLISFVAVQAKAQEDDVCRYLDAYRTGAHDDNGASYRPGVDVHGKPVVPADLNERQDYLPHIIKIPLTVDLAARYNMTLPQGVEMEPVIEEIIITPDGRVMWGAQDLTAETVAMCREKQLNTDGAVLEDKPDADHNQDDEADEELIWGESHLE